MTELLDVVVEAHGGLDRWNQLNNIKAKLTVAGAIWEFKQKPGLLTDVTFESGIHDQQQVVTQISRAKAIKAYFAPTSCLSETKKAKSCGRVTTLATPLMPLALGMSSTLAILAATRRGTTLLSRSPILFPVL